jgi:Cytochrome c554 and c-prime
MRGNGKKNTQAAVALVFFAAAAAVSSPLSQAPASKQQAVNTNWRPNKPTNGVRYVGAQACAGCHRSKVSSQQKTSMGRALAAPENCEVLAKHQRLTFRNGKYEYVIARSGDGSSYTVADGTTTLSVPILYCFGKGEGGQTYVLQYKARFYESRVSFYNDISGLDVTMGHVPTPPPTLEEAMGRQMEMSETRSCFGCHSTNSLDGSTLQLEHLMEGVSCEACHGPGERHVEAMKTGNFAQKQIFNPKRLTTEEVSDFCGSCHRTWEQVALMNIRGVFNVRFQPYRLTNSKCYDPDDSRISCLACHDPHEPRKHDAAFYDSKCNACHGMAPAATRAGFGQSPGPAPRVCPVSKSNCASCHMPRYEIPGSHLIFHDHHIRIVKPGDPYPN